MDDFLYNMGYHIYFLISDHRYWVGLISGYILKIILDKVK